MASTTRANCVSAKRAQSRTPVRAKGKDLAELRRELKRAQWVLALYEFHFPWLTELRDLDEELTYVRAEAHGSDGGTTDPEDPAQHWLSAEEYAALSPADRNQRALDRYLRSRKTPWQLGRDYERYIGYLREQAGARVTYQGIFAGLDGLGRDLVCETAEGIEVVQCKRWSQQKTVHEKHVFQLFGTVVAMRIERPGRPVSRTFTTTTTLSKRAHQFAMQLGIRVEERQPLANYPRIKCNVARDGQRIYHLPFDQQYDATVVEPEKGECWGCHGRRSREARFPPRVALEGPHERSPAAPSRAQARRAARVFHGPVAAGRRTFFTTPSRSTPRAIAPGGVDSNCDLRPMRLCVEPDAGHVSNLFRTGSRSGPQRTDGPA